MSTPCRSPLATVALAALMSLWSVSSLAQAVAWVSSEKDNALTLIDLAKGEVAGTVATCKRPRHMQLTPDGAQLAVACSDSGQADFIDVKTRQSVKRMAIVVEKNPSVLAAVFDVSDAVDANFSTRVKMGQSSNVYAVAMMGDGRVLFSGKEIKVTLGGCGG